MTNDQIIELAKQAGFQVDEFDDGIWLAYQSEIQRFAELVRNAPQAQQPPRIGSGVTVEQTLEQWEHDFSNPMTPEQQTDWVNREREFAARQAQQPRKAVKLTDEEIEELVAANAGYGNNFNRVARAIEQAVLKANGVEE